MTFLIIILALTNMAVGYGLAVYLGNAQAPIQIKLGLFRKSSDKAPAAPAEELESPAANEPLPAPPEPVVHQPPEEVASEEEHAEPETPLQPQVPQIDVEDLMPGAQPSPKPKVELTETMPPPDLPDAAVAPAVDNASKPAGETLAVEEPAPEQAAEEKTLLEESATEPAPDTEQLAEEKSGEPADESAETVSTDEISQMFAAVQEESAAEADESEAAVVEEANLEAEADAAESVEMATAESVEATNEPAEANDGELNDLDTLAQQLQSAVAQSSGDEEESDTSKAIETDVNTSRDTVEQAVIDEPAEDSSVEEAVVTTEQPPNAEKTKSVNDARARIDAFKQQLQEDTSVDLNADNSAESTASKAVEAAPVSAATPAANDSDAAKPVEKSTAASSGQAEEEILAGINAFREQLAQMKDAPPPVVEREPDTVS